MLLKMNTKKNTCFEWYFELSRNEYSKIDNNIDTVESMLAPMHEFFDYLKSVMIVIVIVHVIVIFKKIKNVCVLLINIENFVKKIVLFKKKLQGHI